MKSLIVAVLLVLASGASNAQNPGEVAILRVSIEPRGAGVVLVDGELFCNVFANTWAPGRESDGLHGTPPCVLYRLPGWSGVVTAQSLVTDRDFSGFQGVSYYTSPSDPRPVLADSQWGGEGSNHLQFEISVPETLALPLGPAYLDIRATFPCTTPENGTNGIHFPCGATIPFPPP